MKISRAAFPILRDAYGSKFWSRSKVEGTGGRARAEASSKS